VVVSLHGVAVETAARNYGVMDTENLFRIVDVQPDSFQYWIRMTAPADTVAEKDFAKYIIKRTVRRQDVASSERLAALQGTDDPEMFAGQTCNEASAAVLNRLKSQGETPYVLSMRELDQFFGGLASTASSMPQGGKTGLPISPASMLGLLGSGRHYYRGTLHRRESTDVPFPVLFNGTRVNLPALHAAGSFAFGTDAPKAAELWILDDADFPILLQWQFSSAEQTVIRINSPVTAADTGAGGSAGGGGGAGNLQALAGKSCRTELHGVYFNTGSAQLLPESEPMLQNVAGTIKQNLSWKLTVEGHTDNIGSADYNQDLSQRRAEAVRQALVSRGVPAAQLTAKGYGLTRPVDTNETVLGRAHNRRVELSRACP
jgi:outer membrane protein OmpA-like peptidoglycan-associated protein